MLADAKTVASADITSETAPGAAAGSRSGMAATNGGASGDIVTGSGSAAGNDGGGGASTVAAILGRLPTATDLRTRVGDLWSKSRPWSEFVNTAAMNRPELAELRERVPQNLAHYAYNYATVFAVLVVFMVLVSPLSILGAVLIFALYTYLFVMNPEPLRLFAERVTVGNREKSGVVVVFSLVVLWLTGAGATFTALLFVVAAIALGHAAVRKPPNEADFETAFQPV